jgi:surface antigen
MSGWEGERHDNVSVYGSFATKKGAKGNALNGKQANKKLQENTTSIEDSFGGGIVGSSIGKHQLPVI